MGGIRCSVARLAAAGLLGALAAPAAAQPLSYTATFQVIGGDLDIAPITVSTGVTTGPARAVQVASSVFSFHTTRTLTGGPATRQTISLRNGPGSFAPTPNGFGGPMPLRGFVRYRLDTAFATQPSISYPLSLLGGPPATITKTVGTQSGGKITARVRALGPGSGWRTGTFTMTGFETTPNGGTMATSIQGQGSDQRTTSGAGTLQLVTPFRVEALMSGALTISEPGLGVLTITFVPEPGPGALAGAAGAVLATSEAIRRRSAARRPGSRRA